MVRVKLIRAIATGATGLVLMSSVGTYALGGPGPFPGWDDKDGNRLEVENNNNVMVKNQTNQWAQTGDAVVVAPDQDNDKPSILTFRDRCFDHRWCDDRDDEQEPVVLGDATTGAAVNENKTAIDVEVANAAAPCDCLAQVADDNDCCRRDRDDDSTKITVTNNNNVMVCNTTNQAAVSGDATVIGGSEGSATTGDASNANDTTISVSVSN